MTALTLAPSFKKNSDTASVQVTGASAAGGNVSLLVDGQLMATSALSANGEANFSLGRLGMGTHILFASYGGSSVSAPSASPRFQTTAYQSEPDFTLQALASVAATASRAPVALTVGAVGGWSGTTTFRCASGLPQGYQCVFTPASVSGAGQTTLAIERSEAPAGAALSLLPFVWLLARKQRRQAVVIVLLTTGLVFLSSCATARPGASTRNSIVTVEATSGSLVHSSQFSWHADSK
ncbi:Ig-like domain-containing protein [Granulicella sp. L46]|uniref:Ig-like domain-containing protein n=1 Tax=Granulicella sp. L46 TaxID=1641865 RepID=UPI00131D3F4C|nr:Ig-like domain-containing protein [Granulicella sp. L46]